MRWVRGVLSLLISGTLTFGSLAGKQIEIFLSKPSDEAEIVDPEKEFSNDLYKLSNWIDTLQGEFHEVGCIDTLWVGGECARAILDHLYLDKPLEVEKIDLFAMTMGEVSKSYLQRFTHHFNDETYGFFSNGDSELPTTSPKLCRNDELARWAIEWSRSNGEVMTLFFNPRPSALDFNSGSFSSHLKFNQLYAHRFCSKSKRTFL